ALDLSHKILQELAEIRRGGKEMTYLRPDSKSQVTIRYSDDHKPEAVTTIVVSTQHDDFVKPTDSSAAAKKAADDEMLKRIEHDVINILMPRVIARLDRDTQRLFGSEKHYVNPTGTFV